MACTDPTGPDHEKCIFDEPGECSDMKINCSLAKNKFTRKALDPLYAQFGATSPLTFFVNSGIVDITDDSSTENKSYLEIAADCKCKNHPTGFISDQGV